MKHSINAGKVIFLSCVMGCIMAFGGCGSGGSSSGSGGGCTAASAISTTSVTIQNSLFDPDCIKVSQDQTVTWINNDSVSHSVVSNAGAPEEFTGPPMTSGQTFSHTFTATTTSIGYHCGIHPHMAGTVFVQ